MNTMTFNQCFSAHYETYKKSVEKKTANNRHQIYMLHIQPFIGNIEITDIHVKDLMSVFKKLENDGKTKTVKSAFQIINQVYNYSVVVLECCEFNKVQPLRDFLVRHNGKNHPFLPENRMSALFTEVQKKGGLSKKCKVAFMLIAYTAVRSNEATQAKWNELDLENATWTIPATRMKMRREHIVPLSKQVIALLKKWQAESIDSEYVFPRPNKNQAMRGWSLSRAITKTKFDKMHVMHGFRHRFSTSCYESNLFRDDAIELCLAHKPSGIKAVYNKAQYIDERKEIMQWYADKIETWARYFEI